MIEMVKVMVERSNNLVPISYDAIRVTDTNRIVAIIRSGGLISNCAPIQINLGFEDVGLCPVIEYNGICYIANDGIPLFSVNDINGYRMSYEQLKEKIEQYILEIQDITNDSYYDFDIIHKYVFLEEELAHRIQIKYKPCYYGNDKGENVLMKKIFIDPDQKRPSLMTELICSIRSLNGEDIIVYREVKDNHLFAFVVEDLIETVDNLDKIVKVL